MKKVILLILCIWVTSIPKAFSADVDSNDIKKVEAFFLSKIQYYLNNDTAEINKLIRDYFNAERAVYKRKNIPSHMNITDSMLEESRAHFIQWEQMVLQDSCNLTGSKLLDYAITFWHETPFKQSVQVFQIALKLMKMEKDTSYVYYLDPILIRKRGDDYNLLFYCNKDWGPSDKTQFGYAKDHYLEYFRKEER